MPNGQTPTDTPEVWGQILFEAREIRKKQDARLSSAQRQSQLVVAGFFATTAIFLTAVSIYVASRPENTAERTFAGSLEYTEPLALVGAAAFTAIALLNGAAWVYTHRVARRWQEVPEFRDLMDFPGGVDALAQLRRHLVRTLLTHYNTNEHIVRRAQRAAGAQGAMTLVFVYWLSAVWVVL